MIEETAASSKARRRADLALVGTYHEARLAELLETVRDGFARYDAGESDAFELDDLIHRYKRATRELWKLCGNMTGSSARTSSLARSRRCRRAVRRSTGGSGATRRAIAGD